MARPKAYDPQQGYKYQILCRNPSYDKAYEHCDYAVDKADKDHLLKNYREAYGAGFQFLTITLPKKFWPDTVQVRRFCRDVKPRPPTDAQLSLQKARERKWAFEQEEEARQAELRKRRSFEEYCKK